MSANPADSFVLFDIDGTLLRRAGPHHRGALEQAVRLATGQKATTEGIPVHGMLDRDILTLMLRAAGFDEARIAAELPWIVDRAEEIYLSGVPDLRGKRCPGIPDLLDELEDRGIPMALVTGNLTRIGWHKLDRARIRQYFRFGAFGEMAETRGALARMAIDRARRDSLIGPETRISLIGDAPQDIQAARENGIQAISVLTGITPPADLEAARPDRLLPDLTKLDISIL